MIISFVSVHRPILPHKKSVALFVFIGTFEVFDYLIYPITTIKPTPTGGIGVARSG